LTLKGSFRNATGLRVPFEGEMGGDHGVMLVRFDDNEAVIDAVRGDDDIAQRDGYALFLQREPTAAGGLGGGPVARDELEPGQSRGQPVELGRIPRPG
jgi:hypothetical protein